MELTFREETTKSQKEIFEQQKINWNKEKFVKLVYNKFRVERLDDSKVQVY